MNAFGQGLTHAVELHGQRRVASAGLLGDVPEVQALGVSLIDQAAGVLGQFGHAAAQGLQLIGGLRAFGLLELLLIEERLQLFAATKGKLAMFADEIAQVVVGDASQPGLKGRFTPELANLG